MVGLCILYNTKSQLKSIFYWFSLGIELLGQQRTIGWFLTFKHTNDIVSSFRHTEYLKAVCFSELFQTCAKLLFAIQNQQSTVKIALPVQVSHL